MQLLLSKVAEILGCEAPEYDVMLTGAVIDSRKVEAANLFVALKGEKVDGHNYIETARLAGAGAALVTEAQPDDLAQLVVDDVVAAFAQIAKYWQQQCKAKLVAITGSNGKTTVKEMVASVLSQCGSVIATQGNLNNELGVPLTLCRLELETDFAVIEMGANHPGEIARLVDMASPIVSLINNVSEAHLEGFESIEGVAAAKGEILAGLGAEGVGIVNADMPFISDWKQVLTNKKMLTFSLDSDADMVASDMQLDPQSSHFMVKRDGEYQYINLPLPGRHNVANALAAITVAHVLDIPSEAIAKGLAEMKGVPHRLQLRKGLNQSRLIDDSYNANPGSYQRALEVLTSFNGQHWLVLGDFGELGNDVEKIHVNMGLEAKKAGVDRMWTVGKYTQLSTNAFGDKAEHFNCVADMQAQLKEALTDDVTCLIKGSRFMQLDKLADQLVIEGES